MTYLQESEKAEAAPTASDPLDTEIIAPVSPDNSNGDFLPDENSLSALFVDGADLLDRIKLLLLRFINYPSEAHCFAHVLWIAHTHLLPAWFTTPRLAVLSSDPGSGKSRVLELTALLVARAVLSVQSSPAYITRKIRESEIQPTLLCDEIDAIFGPSAKGNEDLRAVINSGYRRGTFRGVCFTEKGRTFTEELPLFAPVALGGLGTLPETIMSRSIIIQMRKCLPDEWVETFNPRVHEPEAKLLFNELVQWAEQVGQQAKSHEPRLPTSVKDRNDDIWRPIIATADIAGGHWPDTAREIAVELIAQQKAEAEPPIGVKLLAEVKACFGTRDRVATQELLRYLLADEEAPWGDLSGKKIDSRKLAGLLKPYGVKSDTIWIGRTQCKGYKRESFHDVWLRYLPSDPKSETLSEVIDVNEEEPNETLRSKDLRDESVPDENSA